MDPSNSPPTAPSARAQPACWSWPLVPLLLIVLLGCPPSREQLGGGQESSTALLLSVYFPSMQARAATLLIPREPDMECSEPGYGLSDDDPEFLSVDFLRGDLHEWPGEYGPSGSSEECSGSGYYYYYSDLEDQRCLVSVNGLDSRGEAAVFNEDSRLLITSYNDTTVNGSIRTSDEQIEYFSAKNCGERMQYGYIDGGDAPGLARDTERSPWALRFR